LIKFDKELEGQESWKVKIADFGISRKLSNEYDMTDTYVGTKFHIGNSLYILKLAPEIEEEKDYS
jgi:hypothetical protein